jgi:hypothetical protein
MQTISKDEIERLAALRALKLLDTPPTQAFDRITCLAAAAIRVPVTLISLVDETRQWIKSHFGLELRETPRESSICSHALQSRKPLLVPDTQLDARFRANPPVTGPPYIRAYVGVPIFTPLGHAIGTLCAIDRQPRNFDSGDIELPTDFARLLEDVIHAQELSKNADVVLKFAGDRDKLFRDTVEHAGVGMVHVSVAGKLMRANQHACQMLGLRTGRPRSDVGDRSDASRGLRCCSRCIPSTHRRPRGQLPHRETLETPRWRLLVVSSDGIVASDQQW